LEIFKDEGAHGFNPADYQIQLTRRLRGMPLWFSLAMHGTEKYRDSIERGIELAKIAAEKIQERDYLELVRPSSLSVVLYRRRGWTPDQYRDWTYKNHREGIALVTPTKWKTNGEEETISRFCFINPDTTEADIDLILDTMK
jgi:glutamate/tyrosine decarboxylase-like PLP-dependent enzyme